MTTQEPMPREGRGRSPGRSEWGGEWEEMTLALAAAVKNIKNAVEKTDSGNHNIDREEILSVCGDGQEREANVKDAGI